MDFAKLQAEVEKKIDDGGNKRRQALSYLFDHPDEVAMLSMRKLATRARVSPATMLKISREFGFESFSAFKAVFQEQVIGTHDYFSAGARSIQDRINPSKPSDLVLRIAKTDLANIEDTLMDDDGRQLDNAVDRVLNADRVYVVGMRACFSVAHYLAYSLSLAREDVDLIDTSAGRLGDRAMRMKSSDVLIAIGFHPYVNATINVVNHAKAIGVRIIAITDDMSSPIIDKEDDALIFSSKSPWVFGSITSAIVLSQALVANLVLRGGESALKKVTEFERELQSFDVFYKA